MSGSGSLGIGIIGFGFMGRTHASAYAAARTAGLPVEVRAVTGGARPEDRTDLPWEPDAVSLLARDDIAAVSLCTPTDSHVELALAALAAGKHVLLEKPVAIRSADVARLARAAGESGLHCMPAMCMRFWPGWPWLREQVRLGRFGAVRSAAFQRMSARPAWGGGFYQDLDRSGGALFDLHVHDADFISWCFGLPASVRSEGTMLDFETRYEGSRVSGPLIARGAWLPDPAVPFTMRYQVRCEEALLEYDLAAAAPLRVIRNGIAEPVPLPAESGYDLEARHFVELVLGRTGSPVATLDEAVQVTRLLEAEAASLGSGGSVAPVSGPR
jgi:predicted dehydrogenase